MIKNTNNIFVGFDRDGTLEIPGLPMSDILKRKMVELEKSGINIFFASGKSMDLLKDLANDIGVNPVLLCAENGGHIYDFKNQHESVVDATKDLARFVELIKECELPPQRHEPKVSIWSKKFDAHVNKAGEIINELIKQHKLDLQVFTYPDGDGGLDVVPPGIDKERLLDFIPQNTAIHYFGDSFNDLCLMESARITPHTVANAKDVVKELVAKRGGRIAEEPAGAGVLSLLDEIFGNM